MIKYLKVIIVILSICYPFIVYWGMSKYGVNLLLILLLFFMTIRLIVGGDFVERKIIIGTILCVGIITLSSGAKLGLMFYPAFINFGLLIVFITSLISPISIIERIARISEPDLTDKAIAYTRKVTWVWSLFFLLNGGLAAITALWASEEIWLLYNGFIAYVLIFTLFLGELIVREYIRMD